MRIQTLAAAAVLSLAATIPLSTAAFADEPCLKSDDLKAAIDASRCPPHLPIGRPERGDENKHRLNLCRGLIHGIIDDEKLHEVTDKVQDRLRDDKPCRDDEPEHKRRHHDDPDDKPSHHKNKSDDSDSDDTESSDSDSSDGTSDDDDDDDTTSTQVKVVPKGSVDTGDGSSL
jgi:hypothetical protein